MEPITFILWKWKGWRGDVYSPEVVNHFCRMLRANLTNLDYKIVCITDDPNGIIECDTYPLWDDWTNLESVGKANCFRRLKLFQKSFSQQFGTRLVSMDLDCVIFKDITSMFTGGESFKIVGGNHAKYNGSMWMLTPGVHEYIWNDFHPVRSPKEIVAARVKGAKNHQKLVGSDQAWMSLKIPDAATWKIGFEHEIASYMLHVHPRRRVPDKAKIVFFAGGTKPWDAAVIDICPPLYDKYRSYQK